MVKDITELMKPRYRLTQLYPDCRFAEGDIFRYDEVATCYWNERGQVALKNTVEQFPNIFKKLQWHEERKPEEMPEYVKGIDGHMKDKFYKVAPPSENGRRWHKDNEIEHRFLMNYPSWVLPATKEEFESYLNHSH